jgi:class 3 adenylate cyclase/DNA-binding NarL/FixJ family response regulator
VVAITVFVADDSILIREGVRAMLECDRDVEVVGVAEDYDGLVAGAEAAHPDVVVTDIRMPPNFQREGIDAAKEIRKRHPGTGVVILSQFDDPDYAVTLLSEGSAGYAYLLKDRIAEGDQLARAIREVATGGSMLDPVIVTALMNPVRRSGGLTREDDELLTQVAAGRTIKAIAMATKSTPGAVEANVERLFVALAAGVSAGEAGALERLRRLHQAIVEREEQGETLSRLLPTGLAEMVLAQERGIGETERLDVTVLMSDIRGFTSISEYADPTVLAHQLNRHRAEMNRAILGVGGTVMQYVGDAVMAVFGAPIATADHAQRALEAAAAMHLAQDVVNAEWRAEGRAAFGLGIGISTGPVAAALLGSEERVEYTIVGDAVNLCQRLQQFAEPGQTVLSETTWVSLGVPPDGAEQLEPQLVRGRETPVGAYRIGSGKQGATT